VPPSEDIPIKQNLASALTSIAELIGERLATTDAIREQHGRDESWHDGQAPDAVCFVQSTEEVAAIMAICHEFYVPVIPYGTGTGMEGQVTAPHGGISLDMNGMDQVLRVSEEDCDCTVQAGVTRKQLNEELRHSGLFFPVDPGANASIAGMASTRASGTNAVRYGTMREAVLSLKVVLPDGKVIETGTRARKSSAGYDLTHVFTGSEGTLGVIVEVTLRLHPQPEATIAARVQFPSVADCANAVISTMQCAIPVARIELLDHNALRAVNQYSKTNYAESPTLFVEFHGTEASAAEQAERFQEICAEYGGQGFDRCAHEEDRNEMWQARHNAAYAVIGTRPGSRIVSTDVCVPVSRLAECIADAQSYADELESLPTILVGHVGDGNFHIGFAVDPDSDEELRSIKAVNEKIVDSALKLGGTCTGEHGIGIGKQQALVREFGAEAVAAMKAIKGALDPRGIMNPGKIFLAD
jgi:D-lactate dehydrogenase (cytochrome)